MNKKDEEQAATLGAAPNSPPPEEKPKKLPWARLILASQDTTVSKEKEVEKRLRANDINTYQDLVTNPNAVISILRDVYGVDYGKLMELAKEYEDANSNRG